MTARELARLGMEMRTAQRDYFRQRNPATLALAKRHEGAFDRACKAALSGLKLFDDSPPPVAPQGGAAPAPHPLQPLAHCLTRRWCSACRMYHQPGECLL